MTQRPQRLALTVLFIWGLVSHGVISQAVDLQFKTHIINAETDYSAAALIDVDRDGRLDIVCGGDWYAAPNWEKHFVADVPRIRGRPDGFSHLEFDVNRDGWTDVITVNYRSRSIKWMEHPGRSLGPWTIHTAVEPGPMETGRLVDVDGDGQLDLLPNGASFAAWWEFRWKEGSVGSAPAWIRHDLPPEAGGHGLGFGDLNQDGRGDIVGQNGWLEAPSDVRNGRWVWHPDFQLERASIPMIVADVDQDGDRDIVWCSAHGFGVYWLEQHLDKDGVRRWTRHAVDTSWSQGHSPLWVDMDGDGRNELVVGKRYMAHGGSDPGEYDPIGIFRYQFNAETRTWRRSVISPLGASVGIGLDPKVADIDRDGDLDLMASGRSGVYWIENLGPGESSNKAIAFPTYTNHRDLSQWKHREGDRRPLDLREQWGLRRFHVGQSLESVHGAIQSPVARVPLDVVNIDERSGRSRRFDEIRYRIDAGRTTTAQRFFPKQVGPSTAAGIVCMFDEPRNEQAKSIAEGLAESGSVCIVPDILLGNETTDVNDLVWQAMRAADVLQAMELVQGESIGLVGDALAGQLGLYVAAQDQRFVATLADASDAVGFLANAHSEDYSLAELIASVAPRSLTIVLPKNSQSAEILVDHGDTAAEIFRLCHVADSLRLIETDPKEEDRISTVRLLDIDRLKQRVPRDRHSN